MTDSSLPNKAELLAGIETSWNTLNAALARLTDQQLTGVHDAQGWTVKDHLSHLTAWERSVAFMLQRQPRHEGMGVDEAVYRSGDTDALNAAIQRQHAARPLPDVQAEFRAVHGQLLAAIQPLTDADLRLPYHHYLPAEAGDDRLAVELILGNTVEHYAEHLDWIETLAAKAPGG